MRLDLYLVLLFLRGAAAEPLVLAFFALRRFSLLRANDFVAILITLFRFVLRASRNPFRAEAN